PALRSHQAALRTRRAREVLRRPGGGLAERRPDDRRAGSRCVGLRESPPTVGTASVGAFELSHWLGAGTDGVRYAGFDAEGHDVEVRHVEPAVLAARARRIALLSRIDHLGLLRIV